MSGESPRSVAAELVVLERRPALRWLLSAVPLLGALAFALDCAGAFAVRSLTPYLVFSVFFGALLWLSYARTNFLARRRPREVRVTPEGGFAGGVLVAPRARIAAGYIQPKPDRASKTLRLVGKHGRILLEAEADEAIATAMLRVLRLDVASRVAVFAGSSPLVATEARHGNFMLGAVGAFILTGFVGSAVRSAALVPVSLLCLALFVLGGRIPSRIAVGADGILICWLWQRRFIPLNQIRSAWPEGNRAIVLELTSGATERIYTSGAKSKQNKLDLADLFDPVAHRNAVFERIREALALQSTGERAADVALIVGRGTRTSREWLEALSRLRVTDGGYREVAVRSEDLWQLVEDPSALEDARAGAAMILRASLDEDGRSRLRVAADATASPKLRIALEAATADSEEEATAALRELADTAEAKSSSP